MLGTQVLNHMPQYVLHAKRNYGDEESRAQTYITVLTEKSYQELYFHKIKDTALTVFCLLFLNNIGW